MNKYKVLITGKLFITTDTEEKAIAYAQDTVNDLHSSLNMSVFSIAEVKEEE